MLGDGNFHTVILVPKTDGRGSSGRGRWTSKIVARALVAWAGRAAASTGLGSASASSWNRSTAPETLAVMRQIKTALDPRGIMNPGKLFLD